MDRRDFIQSSALGLGAVTSLKLDKMSVSAFNPELMATENENILVVVQLFGGNDGINTITPYEWDEYYKRFRPKLHIPQNTVTPISKELGLAMHPSLKKGINEGILGLHKAGKLSIIQGIGYDNPSYSHFRSTDIWFSGIVPPNDGQLLRTGWMGRYFDRYPNSVLPENPYCLHINKNPILMFQGETDDKSIVLESPEVLFEQSQSVLAEKLDAGSQSIFSNEFDYINNIGLQVDHYSKAIKKAYSAGKNKEDYATGNLSDQMKLVARLIDGGLKTKVYSVGIGGFDTHANQGTLDGAHAMLLSQVSEAIASFQADIEKLGHAKRVIGITLSEFGRRPYENGSYGTDHGTANVMFAFGERVKNQIFGGNIAFLPFRDNENLTFRYDFRSIYWEVLRTWFEASSEETEKILGGKFPLLDQVGFIKETKKDESLPPPIVVPTYNADPFSPQNPTNPINVTEQDEFRLIPNPVIGDVCKLNAMLYLGGEVTITQMHMNGRNYGQIHYGNYRAGFYSFSLNVKGEPGLYVLRVQVNNRNHYVKMLKF
jgi:uncharacterized protein (DUF1501 family)